MEEQIVNSWDIHNYLLMEYFDAIPAEAFVTRRARSVGSIFTHLNNLRVAWVEVSAPDLAPTGMNIPAKTKADREKISKALLRPALETTAQAMHDLLGLAASGGAVRRIRPHLIGRLSYFIAHEWYHIGEVGLFLKEQGYPPTLESAYGLWDWGKAAAELQDLAPAQS